MERKAFQDLPGEYNPQFASDGVEIYEMMKKKYGTNNVESLDNILNGICASLILLVKSNVEKEDYKYILQLIFKLLNKNL